MRKEWIFDNKLRNQWDTLKIKDLEWRRGWESNPRIKVLQTSALPLGYRAKTPDASYTGARFVSEAGGKTAAWEVERETGLEPATSTLARSHSTS